MQFLFICLLLAMMSSAFAGTQTPQDILKSEGYVLVTKEADGEVYYRPKEVKRSDGIVWYSTTKFYTKTSKGIQRYSLISTYTVLGCKEQKAATLGIHTVPYIGKASYKDLSKNIKGSSFRNLTKLDRKMNFILCK